MSRARRDRAPSWGVELSTEARDWLTSCTTDQAALARVMSAFSFNFQKLEIAGPQNFPRSVIDLAQKRVTGFLAELGADGFVDED